MSSKFIFWAMKSFFETFRKNQIQKFFGPKNFGLLDIKSVHDRPHSLIPLADTPTPDPT